MTPKQQNLLIKQYIQLSELLRTFSKAGSTISRMESTHPNDIIFVFQHQKGKVVEAKESYSIVPGKPAKIILTDSFFTYIQRESTRTNLGQLLYIPSYPV